MIDFMMAISHIACLVLYTWGILDICTHHGYDNFILGAVALLLSYLIDIKNELKRIK